MNIKRIKTSKLRLAYEETGPKQGEALLLVHGWPDSPRAWDKVIPHLHAAGYCTIAPYLRGYGPSTFRNPILGRKTRRTGQPVAFAQDIIDLADALKLTSFHYIGHDWGARTGYALAALFPQRLKSLVTISVPYQPGKASPPALPQAQAFWYQWLLCTNPGEARFRADPVAFGKAQWDAWSPEGWYSEADFAATAESWAGEDFADVVLHSYRSRWGHAALDTDYAHLQTRFEATPSLNTPTVLLHGVLDHCELARTTDLAERYFTAEYHRVLIDGVGHFPQRESPDVVASEILKHVGLYS